MKQLKTYQDFILKSFISIQNGAGALSPYILALEKISSLYKGLMNGNNKIDMGDMKIINTADIAYIYETGDYGNLMDRVICVIYCSLSNETFLLRFRKENNFLLDVELVPSFVMIKDNMDRYSKDVIFYRLTGKKDGAIAYRYVEDRFNIYNKALRKINYEEFALDLRVINTYHHSVFKSLLDETINNSNHRDVYFIDKL